MSKFDLFESVKTGLEQVIEYEKGNPLNVRVRKVKIEPVHQGAMLFNRLLQAIDMRLMSRNLKETKVQGNNGIWYNSNRIEKEIWLHGQ